MKRTTKHMEEESNIGCTNQNTPSQPKKRHSGRPKRSKSKHSREKQQHQNQRDADKAFEDAFFLYMFLPLLG